MKAFLYRVCAIFFSHFVLYPDYRISFFIPLAFRFADYTYHPDFIFIFNWEERDDVFEGMDFEWQKVYYKDKLQAVYTLPGYSTKVIWTSHPRRYSYLGTNIEEMAGSLADTFAAIR